MIPKSKYKILFITIIFATTGIVALYYMQKPKTLRVDQPRKGIQITPYSQYYDANAQDQDDMCIWIHPHDKNKSLIIAADKIAHKIFVYNMKGETLQTLDIMIPGNIDVRYGFPLGDRTIDIVATTTRGKKNSTVIFEVEADSESLKRIDDDLTSLDEEDRSGNRKSFGGTLFHSHITNKFYFFVTDENKQNGIRQYELRDNGEQRISLELVRKWFPGSKCEGAVADDEWGVVYISQERKGIWKVGAEPNDATPGEMVIIPEGDDISLEGLALYKTSEKNGYLLVSEQNCNSYSVYNRSNNLYLNSFHIKGVHSTDGIDAISCTISDFSFGFFICHNNLPVKTQQRPLVLVQWETIAENLNLEKLSTYKIR